MMAYTISITEDAEGHRRSLSAREQRILDGAVAARLTNEPTIRTKAIKRLRSNPLAEFELRVGNLRVLYNVDEAKKEVVLLAIGRKVGNSLFIGGVEFHEHRSNPPEPPSDRPQPGSE